MCYFFLEKNILLTHLLTCSGVSYSYHWRLMETEAKARVVASVWRAEFIHCLAALAILPWSIWKNRMNSTFSSKSTAARNWINSVPQTDMPTFVYASLSVLILCSRESDLLTSNLEILADRRILNQNRKCLNPFVSGPGKFNLWKTGVRKFSRAVPLNSLFV